MTEGFGGKAVAALADMRYWVAGHLALVITPCRLEYRGERAEQERVGLHHLSIRAHGRKDVDRAHRVVERLGATVVYRPGNAGYGPGRYAMMFTDPDGMHIEVCHFTGRGDLGEPITIPMRRLIPLI